MRRGARVCVTGLTGGAAITGISTMSEHAMRRQALGNPSGVTTDLVFCLL
jgi:hypothetical protein